MTDREIVKALRKQIHIRTIADRGGTNLLILAADAIERLERERDAGWIAVEDRLPEKIGDYFVFNGVRVYKLPLVENGIGEKYWMAGSRFPVTTKDVTHWMPLPEPPCTKPQSGEEG